MLRSLGIPGSARVILTGGNLIRAAGVRDALWAADILKFLYDDLYLLIAGDGPERLRLEQFARDIRIDDRVRFLGSDVTLTEALGVADIVWVPSHSGPATPLLHEALEAGKPLVASRLPAIVALVAHGVAGFLYPPGDKPKLARFTRLLVDDAELRRRMSSAVARR